MNFSRCLVGVVLAVIGPFAYGQDSKVAVRAAVESASQGMCSDVMSISLKYTCEQQHANTAQINSALGKFEDIEFKGVESTPSGMADVYVATYQRGQMIWFAIRAPDGKLALLWSTAPMPK
jgi:hypothetical protein